MAAEKYFYDMRFLFLWVVAFLKSHASTLYAPSFALKDPTEAIVASILIKEVTTVVLIFGLLGVFLLTSIRVQLHCYQPPRSCTSVHRICELRCGGSAFSVPLTLSLSATLFLPSSAFLYSYVPILFMSFWSDSIHDFFTAGFSRIIRCQVVGLPVVQTQADVTLQQLSGLTISIAQDTNTNELSIEEGSTAE